MTDNFLNIFFKKILLLSTLIYPLILIFAYDRTNSETYVFVLFFIMFLSFYLSLYKVLTSPQIILLSSWGICVFLCSLNVTYSSYIAHFNIEVELRTWVLVFASILSFLIGATIAIGKLDFSKVYTNLLKLNRIKLNFIIIFSFSLAMLVYMYAVYTNGGVPAFSGNINESRAKFIPKTIGIFFTFFQLVIVLTVIKVFINGVKESKLSILLSFISFCAILLTTQRIAMIETIIMSFIFIFTFWKFLPNYIKLKNRKKLIVALVIFLSLFITVFIIIGNIRHLSLLQNTDFDNLITEQIFIYFGGPSIRNFQMILPGGYFEDLIDLKSGVLFIREIMFFTPYRSEVNINDIFKGPNNATALFHYFHDYGYIGVVLIPLFWGLVTGLCFRILIINTNIYSIILYLILSSSVWFIPLSERFSEPTTLVKIVLFTIFIFMCQKIKLRLRI